MLMRHLPLVLAAILTVVVAFLLLSACSNQGDQSDMVDTGLKTHEWSSYGVQFHEVPLDRVEDACALLLGHPDKACAKWDPAKQEGTVLLPPPDEITYPVWGCVVAHETRHIREGRWHKADRVSLCGL